MDHDVAGAEGSAAGRLVLNVLASVSQWEREAIGERTSAAMRHMAASGEYTGGRSPFGYRLADDGKTLEADDAEQAVRAEARALRAAGGSLRAISSALASRGMVSRTGRPFGPPQVARIVGA